MQKEFINIVTYFENSLLVLYILHIRISSIYLKNIGGLVMERIYLKNLTNLYLIHQKYATLEKAVKDSIGVDKLEQDMFVDKNTVEEMYINLDQVYESLELFHPKAY